MGLWVWIFFTTTTTFRVHYGSASVRFWAFLYHSGLIIWLAPLEWWDLHSIVSWSDTNTINLKLKHFFVNRLFCRQLDALLVLLCIDGLKLASQCCLPTRLQWGLSRPCFHCTCSSCLVLAMFVRTWSLDLLLVSVSYVDNLLRPYVNAIIRILFYHLAPCRAVL